MDEWLMVREGKAKEAIFIALDGRSYGKRLSIDRLVYLKLVGNGVQIAFRSGKIAIESLRAAVMVAVSVCNLPTSTANRDFGCSDDRKVWLSWLADRSLEIIAAPQHRPTAAIRQVILDYLNGVGKNDRNALWWQKYSTDASEHQISDDDRLTLLKILAREIPI